MSGFMNHVTRKVAVDIFWRLSTWMAWCLPFYIGFFIIEHFVPQIQIDLNFFDGTIQSAKVYMLVVGIILALSVPGAYIRNGVTRKNMFNGVFIGMSCTVGVLSLVVQILYGLSLWIFGNEFGQSNGLSQIYHNQFLSLFLIFFLLCVIYFAIGWLIGLAFSRYGFLSGMFSIALSIVLVGLSEYFWNSYMKLPWRLDLLMSWLPDTQILFVTGFVGSAVILALLIALLHMMIRRMPIKP
ncbi:MAG: hypothetical protein ABF629_09255 [Sporolactobacillus sp.]|uniref:hypothetical protein n=1 Tax=Sporolactobacillus sp. STSJ-5 TaxID=2965076 RepID=UPI0021024F82|nr:hypothetical protein [Sporolactobacillus sp. STSJ-5]MCQ2011450.1 hypothetical protein [Sporolactobacillus sp. STSJ-5]